MPATHATGFNTGSFPICTRAWLWDPDEVGADADLVAAILLDVVAPMEAAYQDFEVDRSGATPVLKWQVYEITRDANFNKIVLPTGVWQTLALHEGDYINLRRADSEAPEILDMTGRWESDQYGRPFALEDMLGSQPTSGIPPVFGAVGDYLEDGYGNTADLAVPLGVEADDILIAVVYKENNAIVTPAAGFAEIPPVVFTTGSQDQYVHLFWKRATTTDSGTYSFSWSGSPWRTGAVIRISGCKTTGAPFEPVQPSSYAARSTPSITTPAVSHTVADDSRLLVWIATAWDLGTWAAPAGFTGHLSTPDQRLLHVATAEADAGSTGNITSSSAPNYAQTARLLALIPA